MSSNNRFLQQAATLPRPIDLDLCSRESPPQSRESHREHTPTEREVDTDLRSLIKALALKPASELHPTKFGSAETENILDWAKEFKRIALYNGWTDQQAAVTLPLSLTKSALIFYEGLNDSVKCNIEKVLEKLEKEFHSVSKQWTLQAKLYGLKQTGTLESFIDELEALSQQLTINDETKLDLFTNGVTKNIRNALLIKQSQFFTSRTVR